MKWFVLACCAVLALILAAAPAFSQDYDRALGKGRSTCTADVEKFCKGIKPGQGRIWECLKSNEANLSGGCKEHIAQQKEKAQAFQAACKPDVQRFCEGMKAGQGRIVACLKGHAAELSEPCKAMFNR